jgi:CRISPR/Cas system-associated endoribonuclease Cas2
MQAVESFDPSTLMQGVKDRIKATFVSLIPDDRWDEMVKNEVDFFFKIKDRGYEQNQYSDFQATVNSELVKECKNRLVKYLSSPEFSTIWNTNGMPYTSKAVEDMIIKNSGEIMAQMFNGMFTNVLQNFRQNLIR